MAIPTKHKWLISQDNKEVKYFWKVNNNWNTIEVNASTAKYPMNPGSLEAFIFEHYWGYTKVNNLESIEYKINHPSWLINRIHSFNIRCNFSEFYGKNFTVLDSTQPNSVMIAEGSDISVDWRRKSF